MLPSRNSGTTARRDRSVRLLYGIPIVALSVGYALGMLTPLRLQFDSVILLSMADSVAHGGNFLFEGHPTVFPPGYPAVVALLLRFGMPYTWALVALNLISICVGLSAATFLLIRRLKLTLCQALNIGIFSTLSFVFIRHSVLPQTDLLFFALTMCCLCLMRSLPELDLGAAFLKRMAASWLVLAAAIMTRRIGLALLPALLWAIVSHPQVKARVKRWGPRVRLAAAAATLLAGTLTVLIINASSTLRDWHAGSATASIVSSEYQIVMYRLCELGQIASNAIAYPEADQGRGYVSSLSLPLSLQNVMPVVGALLLVALLAGVIRARFGPAEVYIVSYVGVMFVWPYYDPRFWLPIIPLLAGYAWLTLRPFFQRSASRALGFAYLGIFAATGLWWIIASTAITISGPNFPNVYVEGYYHSTYCSMYQSCKNPVPAGFPNFPISQPATHLLNTFK